MDLICLSIYMAAAKQHTHDLFSYVVSDLVFLTELGILREPKDGDWQVWWATQGPTEQYTQQLWHSQAHSWSSLFLELMNVH